MAPRAATSSRSPGSARLRRRLVEQLEASGCLTSPPVRRAFLAVPRERFLPEVEEREGLERVYEDQAIVTAYDGRGVPTSSSSQPAIMASMLERLELKPGLRVLEVGAGTGYNAALLARIVGGRGRVVSVELDPATVRRARRGLRSVGSPAVVVRGDGREGWRRGAPYDRIIVTASAASLPSAWRDQLEEGGLLELPLRAWQVQAVITFRREAEVLRSVALVHGGFMPLREAPGAPVPPSPPTLSATDWDGRRPRSLTHLSGPALARLSRTRRRRLLALALGEPRTRSLGLRAPRLDLTFYVMLESPEERVLGGWPGPGVMSDGGGGLALLAGGAKSITRIESYGDEDAERLLLDLIEGWKARGRPGAGELRIEASFGEGGESRLAFAWGT